MAGTIHRVLVRGVIVGLLTIGGASSGLWAGGPVAPAEANFDKLPGRAEKTLNFSGRGARLIVDNAVGDIHITADPAATEIRAEAKAKARAKTDDEARRLLEQVVIGLESAPDGSSDVRASSKHPGQLNNEWVSVDWTITVPVATGAAIESAMGDVWVNGIEGGLKVDSSMGDLVAINIAGGFEAELGMGDIDAKASGVIRAKTGMGDASVKTLGTAAPRIEVESGMGDVEIVLPESFAGTIDGTSGMGDVNVRALTAKMSEVRRGERNFTAVVNAGAGSAAVARSGMGDVEIVVGSAGGAD